MTLNSENLISQDWRLHVLTLKQHVTALPLKVQEKALPVSSNSRQFQALLGSWLLLSPLSSLYLSFSVLSFPLLLPFIFYFMCIGVLPARRSV